jgi:hypothetical protein
MIRAVGYGPETRHLEVVFNTGRIYCYEGFEPEVYLGLLAAESNGSVMRAYPIDRYPYRRGPCRREALSRLVNGWSRGVDTLAQLLTDLY